MEPCERTHHPRIRLDCRGDNKKALRQAIVEEKAQAFNECIEAIRCADEAIGLLSLAAEYGRVSFLEALLLLGCDVNEQCDELSRTPLILAAEFGRIAAVRSLLAAGANLRRVDEFQRTALFAAVESGRADIADLLATRDAELPRIKNDLGWSALEVAASNGHLELLPLLLRYGAEVDHQDVLGWTPLLAAAQNGHVDCADFLMANRASLGLRDKFGRTALAAACQNGRAECVELLMTARSSPGSRRSPANLAGGKGHVGFRTNG